VTDGKINVRGLVASLDGRTIYKSEKAGLTHDAVRLGRALGEELLQMGAAKILDEIYG
jgi:hydroxymethylbilane synthase